MILKKKEFKIISTDISELEKICTIPDTYKNFQEYLIKLSEVTGLSIVATSDWLKSKCHHIINNKSKGKICI